MTDQERPAEEEEQQESELAPEVSTSFATKGEGWSGREKDDLDVVDLET